MEKPDQIAKPICLNEYSIPRKNFLWAKEYRANRDSYDKSNYLKLELMYRTKGFEPTQIHLKLSNLPNQEADLITNHNGKPIWYKQ